MIIIKVPGLASGKSAGCRNAGNAIISKLDEIYSNEKGKIIDKNLLDLEEIHVNNAEIDKQDELIYKNSLETFETEDRIIFLGGDSSISLPIGKAFLNHCNAKGKEPCLIAFDSNPKWIIKLIEKGFPIKNILLVGARNLERDEIVFLSKTKIRQIGINELNNNIEDVTDVIMEFSSGKELYVSFDINIIDPAFAPSTPSQQPGGLTSRQALYIVSRISLMKNLKASDITDIDSERDKEHGGLTVKLAAKLLAELL